MQRTCIVFFSDLHHSDVRELTAAWHVMQLRSGDELAQLENMHAQSSCVSPILSFPQCPVIMCIRVSLILSFPQSSQSTATHDESDCAQVRHKKRWKPPSPTTTFPKSVDEAIILTAFAYSGWSNVSQSTY